MPLAAMTQAACRANSWELFRQSKQMAMPCLAASAPSSRITWAKAWVAWRMTWTFIRFRPTPIIPRRPAVPKASWSKKRDSFSFSSLRMDSSSAFSWADRAGLLSHAS